MKELKIFVFYILFIFLPTTFCFAQVPKTVTSPGVYVQEIGATHAAIAEVETAVPAFIGYTEIAKAKKSNDLLFVPKKISSFFEFEKHFGLSAKSNSFVLYETLQLYFNNGGGGCYIVSIGNYNRQLKENFIKGLNVISNEDEPTLLVFPDAVNLPDNGLYEVQKEALQQAAKLKDRFCILDLKLANTNTEHINVVNEFRNNIGNSNLKYGAVYTPYINSTLAKTALPPSAAVAALYCLTDKTQGVWKAPANVGIKNIASLSYNISPAEQTTLNVDAIAGKSVNAIRNFTGKGFLIWGARTLAGNDNEWRYVPVRRFFNTVEESIRIHLRQYVFDPNNSNTWRKIKTSIENYLSLKWREGALAGAKPEHAFYVKVGLGETMTNQDILDKKIVIQYGLAVVRPAEFIVSKIVLKVSN